MSQAHDLIAETRRREIEALLEGLQRDKFFNLKGERLRQLARIGLSMTASLSDKDFEILKAEISKIRKAQIARLEKWHKLSGGGFRL